MIDKNTWRAKRDSSCKDCNVGKCLDEYHKSCKPAAGFKKFEEFDAARKACKALAEAFAKAAGKVQGKKEAKAVDTANLIKLAEPERLKYQTNMEQDYERRVKLVEKEFTDGEAVIAGGVTKAQKLTHLLKTQLEGAVKIVKSLKEGAKLDEATRKKIRGDLSRWEKAGENLTLELNKVAKDVRDHAQVAFIRGGNDKVLNKHGVGGDERKAYKPRWANFTKGISNVEKVVGDGRTWASNLKVISTQGLMLSNRYLNDKQRYTETLKKAQIELAKEIDQLNRNVLTKGTDSYAEQMAKPEKERKTWPLNLVQSHIDGVKLAIGRRDTTFPKIEDSFQRCGLIIKGGIVSLPKELLADTDIAKLRSEMIKSLNDTRLKADKYKNAFDENVKKMTVFREWLKKRAVELSKK